MGLWLSAGFVVWNVVFDQMIVQASRDYVFASSSTSGTGGRGDD